MKGWKFQEQSNDVFLISIPHKIEVTRKISYHQNYPFIHCIPSSGHFFS